MNLTVYNITPVSKPRMTRSDKWKKRTCVEKYRSFKDEVRLKQVTLPESGYHVIFVLPMPKSWSKKKKSEMYMQPHRQRPDKDNLEKALLDALFQEDSHIWDGRVTKIWGETGAIMIIKDIDSTYTNEAMMRLNEV
jgi:Holliday junction resolvase RusA-like endonuclease